MKAVEEIYEYYKAAHNEETPVSEEQYEAMEKLVSFLHSVDIDANLSGKIFGLAAEYARSAEKNGFTTGFMLGIRIMMEK